MITQVFLSQDELLRLIHDQGFYGYVRDRSSVTVLDLVWCIAAKKYYAKEHVFRANENNLYLTADFIAYRSKHMPRSAVKRTVES